MRKIFFLPLMLLCTCCFGQNWTILKIDSNISIKLPPYNELIDTSYEVSSILKLKTIVAFIDSGKIVLTKGPYLKDAKPIKNEKTLLSFYDGVKEGLVGTVKGELLSDSVIEINNLKIQKLQISLNYEGESCVLHYLGFLLNQNKYSLQVLEFASKDIKIGNSVSDLLIFSGDLRLTKQLTQ